MPRLLPWSRAAVTTNDLPGDVKKPCRVAGLLLFSYRCQAILESTSTATSDWA